MSWCPNCKYEYYPQITVCPDCGSELTEQDPVVIQHPVRHRRSLPYNVWKYAAITFLVPWIWYGMVGLSTIVPPDNVGVFVFRLIETALLLAPVIYGYCCRAKISPGIFEGWVLGSSTQVILSMILFIPFSRKLIYYLPLAIIGSAITMLSIWMGSVVRTCMRTSK